MQHAHRIASGQEHRAAKRPRGRRTAGQKLCCRSRKSAAKKVLIFLKKAVDKTIFMRYNNQASSMRNCVKVARQTLTLFVWVRILVPQPCRAAANVLLLFFRGVAQLVECCVRDAEAASSNLATPTILKKPVTKAKTPWLRAFLMFLALSKCLKKYQKNAYQVRTKCGLPI